MSVNLGMGQPGNMGQAPGMGQGGPGPGMGQVPGAGMGQGPGPGMGQGPGPGMQGPGVPMGGQLGKMGNMYPARRPGPYPSPHQFMQNKRQQFPNGQQVCTAPLLSF